MGAFKDRTGKTRVGKVLSSIGGFFTNIFKKNPTTSTNTNTTPNTTPTTTTPTTTASSGGSGWSDLALGVGGVLVSWLGLKIGQNGTDYSTDPSVYAAQKKQEQEQTQGIGQNVIIGIVLVIVSVVAYLFLRKK